jgi:hypothetical protein
MLLDATHAKTSPTSTHKASAEARPVLSMEAIAAECSKLSIRPPEAM